MGDDRVMERDPLIGPSPAAATEPERSSSARLRSAIRTAAPPRKETVQ